MTILRYDVIYMDDDPMMVELFTQFIGWKYRHWNAFSITNPLLLWKQVRARELAARVWIIDVMMPEKNGCDIAEAIRAQYGSAEQIIGYTALETGTLRSDPQYSRRLELFNHIVRKNEGIARVLLLAEELLAQAAP
jgi:CheY-like chemotaxis protein